MPNYVLSPQAQRSLLQISDYTLNQFGQQQKKKYLQMLRQRMREAAAAPTKGRRRGDIKPGYFSIQAGKHHIYYRQAGERIEIIDVLHQSMEPNLHLR